MKNLEKREVRSHK